MKQSRNTGVVGSASYMVSPALHNVAAGWVDKDMKTVRKMAVDGSSAHEIGAVLGWSPERVKNFVKRHNLVWNHKIVGNDFGGAYQAPDGWRERATALRLAGWGLTAIEAAVGVSASSVGLHFRETGVPDPHLSVGRKPSGRAAMPMSDRQRSRLCAAAIRRAIPSHLEAGE